VPDDASVTLKPESASPVKPARAKGGAGWRKLVPFIVGGVVVLMAGLWIGHWATIGRYQVTTENAYIRADISMISARVEGYVRTLAVEDNQIVHTRDVLLEIEPADYQTDLAEARADLAQAQGSLSAQRAARAQATADMARYRELADRGFLSRAGWDAIVARNRSASGGEAAAIAAVEAAQTRIDAASLDIDRTIVRAPIDGVIGDRQVQIGQLVREGAPLMAIVPLQSVYVVANFKETQIENLHTGQSVTIEPDVAHSLHLHGQVVSIAPASGSQFSIIPTDTATGNFTKIVQRVPVRISIDPDQPGVELLRPGLSATVVVDTRG
jgi:membrane fusion protein (multidrug efflux system)